MSVKILRGNSDEVVDKIVAALQQYKCDHPKSEIGVYRQNSVSVRVRIIDPEFEGLSKPQRSKMVWEYLGTLTEEVQSDISTVVLLTAEEKKMSFANFEFENPVPSKL